MAPLRWRVRFGQQSAPPASGPSSPGTTPRSAERSGALTPSAWARLTLGRRDDQRRPSRADRAAARSSARSCPDPYRRSRAHPRPRSHPREPRSGSRAAWCRASPASAQFGCFGWPRGELDPRRRHVDHRPRLDSAAIAGAASATSRFSSGRERPVGNQRIAPRSAVWSRAPTAIRHARAGPVTPAPAPPRSASRPPSAPLPAPRVPASSHSHRYQRPLLIGVPRRACSASSAPDYRARRGSLSCAPSPSEGTEKKVRAGARSAGLT